MLLWKRTSVFGVMAEESHLTYHKLGPKVYYFVK